jgi:hypothetical protein
MSIPSHEMICLMRLVGYVTTSSFRGGTGSAGDLSMKLSHSPPRPRIIANSVERRRGSDEK